MTSHSLAMSSGFHPSRGGAFFYYTADGTLGHLRHTYGGLMILDLYP